MAVIGSSATSAVVGGWHQLQRVQAQRIADQAEQEASALKAKAQAAENKADQAQEEARDVGIRSDSAQERARVARSGVQSLEGWNAFLHGSSAQGNSATPVVNPVDGGSASATSGASATINAEGQATGRIISVEA